MYKQIERIIFTSCVCLILGCTNKQEQSELLPCYDIVEGIEDDGSKMFLTDIAENIEFVPFETTDECLIGRNYTPFFSDKYIIISEWQQHEIFLFDKTGRFLRKIGSRGNGPGEYLHPSFFDISGDNLFIWDYDKYTLFRYDLNTGKRLYEKHYSNTFNPHAIKCIGDSLLICYSPCPSPDSTLKNFYHLHTLNFDFTIVNDLQKGNFTEQFSWDEYGNIQDGGTCTYIKDDNLHVYMRDKNTVYRVTDSLEVIPAYELFLGKYTTNKTPERGGYKFNIIGVHESNRFLFITGIFNEEYAKCILYDKTTAKSKNIIYNLDFHDVGFHNDIDGSIPFWPEGYVSKNILYGKMSILGLQRLMNHPYTINSIKVKNSEKHKKIKDYLDSAQEDDNPILFFVTMK
jgi:hypothetical protein